MFRQRARLLTTIVWVFDMAVTALAYPVSFALRRGLEGHEISGLGAIPSAGPLSDYGWALWVALPVMTVLFYLNGVYESQRTRSIVSEIGRIFRSVLGGFLVLSAVAFLIRDLGFSRLLMLIFALVSGTLLAVERILIRQAARVARRQGFNYRNVLIVGTGERAARLGALVEGHRDWGLRLLGFLQTGQEAGQPSGGTTALVIGRVEELPQVLDRLVVDEVLFAVPRQELAELEEWLTLCRDSGVRTLLALEAFSPRFSATDVEDFAGERLLTFSMTPTNEWFLFFKRAGDIFLSLMLLILCLPVMGLIALLIQWDSPGPVFFRQTRVGLNGRRFTLLKFRSMVQDAEARQKELLAQNQMNGPVFKLRDDPRVTRIGWILRRTSLDELPQLLNVLRGDMSLVGPRPPVPDEVERYQRWQRRRLSMRPGLTCLWQVRGRNEIDFDAWMRMDLEYIDRWSLWLDAKILLRTIPAVLSGRGAV